MTIRNVPLVPAGKLFDAINVSREHGRKRMRELQAEGVINPLVTPTKRPLLSFADAERLVAAL